MQIRFKHPIKLLIAAHTCSLLVFSYLYWNHINYTTLPVSNSDTNSSIITILDALTKAAGEGIGNLIHFIGSVALLYLLFLIGLKMVCNITFKELGMFILITIPLVLLSNWVFSFFQLVTIQTYSFPITLIFISFILLKFSGHWDFQPEEGLQD